MKTILISLASVAMATASFANPVEDMANQYVEIIKENTDYSDIAKFSAEQALDGMGAQGISIPEDKMEEATTILSGAMEKVLPEVTDLMPAAMAEYMNEAEMKALLDFVSTEEGLQAMMAQQKVGAVVGAKSQEIMMPTLMEAMTEIMPLLQQ